MPRLVAGHLVDGVVDGIEAVLLRAGGEVKLALNCAVLAVDAPGEVLLRGVGHIGLELGAEELGKFGGVLGLLIGGLLPVEADLGIALAVGDARHAEVHTDLGALAGEVRLELLENVCLVGVGDIGVILYGLVVDAVLVGGGELYLALYLGEAGAGDLAYGAELGGSVALVDIAANGAEPFFHSVDLHLIIKSQIELIKVVLIL